MGWRNYYNLLEKYDGDLGKASPQEMHFAARCNPNDPATARRIAEARWKDELEAQDRNEQREAEQIADFAAAHLPQGTV